MRGSAKTGAAVLLACCLAAVGAWPLTVAAQAPSASPAAAQPSSEDDATLIIVAVDDAPEALPGAGTSPRAHYRRSAGYAGSVRAAAAAAALAQQHRLQEQAFWHIGPLQLRCMVYRVAPGADRSAVLVELERDARVRLAQAVNRFDTFADPAHSAGAVPVDEPYNDPYLGLQRGFAAMDTAEAQRWSRGRGVRVALIDTGIDAAHPDLQGRVAGQRDFAGIDHPASATERHGTQMAGVIAAGANNGVGIVGMAPQAQLLAYRACWAAGEPAGAARCNSFTLAKALVAAITADADVINLSLGGPADPLLQRLAEHAMKRGAIVVGAVPPSGSLDGFPIGVPGVLAVDGAEQRAPRVGVLAAPGRDVLTLVPGGHYDFASGSSLAAAHVSGAIALLRELDPGLRADTARAWLQRAAAIDGMPMDVCAAVRRLRAAARCGHNDVTRRSIETPREADLPRHTTANPGHGTHLQPSPVSVPVNLQESPK